jgi:peptidoglycan/LPS O-acetylase OafA/YrhL
MNDRFENVNLLRAFAATAVVVYHVIVYANWTDFPSAGPLVAFRIGWIGVDLFFVISGFVITRSALALWRQDPAAFAGRYWARRGARIVPLYVLTCALWILLFRRNWFDESATRLLWQIGAHLTFTHTFWPFTYDSIDGVNWTLGLEMQFYLLVALLVPWIARTPGWRIWVAGILVAWAWRGAMFHFFGHYEPNRLFTRVMQLPGALDEFGAGIFLAKLLDRRPVPSPREGALWSLGAVATGAACFGLYWPNAGYWDLPAMVTFWRTSLGAFFLCVVAAAVRLPTVAWRWPLRPVRYLGEVSYGIYLWHLFAIEVCLWLGDLAPMRFLAVTLGLTVLVAAVSWHFFEKPILEIGRRYRGRGAPRAPPAPAGTP